MSKPSVLDQPYVTEVFNYLTPVNWFSVLTIFLMQLSAFRAGATTASPRCSDTPTTKLFAEQISSEKILLVTHASNIWDTSESAASGVNFAVSLAKSAGVPVVYLQGGKQPETYYYQDCNPNYRAWSLAGEFYFKLSAKHVISVGGHLEACQKVTIKSAIFNLEHFHPDENIVITYFAPGLYLGGSLERGMPLFSSVDFKNKVSFGDVMGLVRSDDDKLDLFWSNLLLLEYMPLKRTIELNLNNGLRKKVVLDRGDRAPKIVFNLITEEKYLQELLSK
jgi:hypothetical protein